MYFPLATRSGNGDPAQAGPPGMAITATSAMAASSVVFLISGRVRKGRRHLVEVLTSEPPSNEKGSKSSPDLHEFMKIRAYLTSSHSRLQREETEWRADRVPIRQDGCGVTAYRRGLIRSGPPTPRVCLSPHCSRAAFANNAG